MATVHTVVGHHFVLPPRDTARVLEGDGQRLEAAMANVDMEQFSKVLGTSDMWKANGGTGKLVTGGLDKVSPCR
jgi:hypothetical protein